MLIDAPQNSARVASGPQDPANLRALLESSADLMWSVDRNYRLLAFNSAFARYAAQHYGVRVEIGKRPADLLPPDVAAFWEPLLDRALSTGPFCAKFPLTGSPALEVSLHPIVTAGQVTGVALFGRDVTERSSVERELRETAAFLEQTQRIGVLGSYVFEFPSGRWTSSAVLDELFGIDAGYDRTAEGWVALVHPDDRAMMYDYFITEVLGKRQEFDKEYRIVRLRDQVLRWVHGIGRLEFDAGGQPVKMRGVIKDITSRKLAERAILDSREFTQSTIDALSTTICVLDESGAIIAVNRTWKQFAEKNRQQRAGSAVNGFPLFGEGVNYLDVCDAATGPDAAQATAFAAGIRSVIDGSSEDFSLEYACHSPEEKRWFVGRVTRFEASGPVRVVIEHINITAMKQGEILLLEAADRLSLSEERYRCTFEQAPVGIVHTAPDGTFLRCNARFAEILGYSQDEVPGMTVFEVTALDDRSDSLQKLSGTVDGHARSSWEKRYIRKDGSLVWVRVTASAQKDDDGRLVHFLALVEDIDSLKSAEQQLVTTAQSLRLSEERYRKVFQTSLDPITINRIDTKQYLDVNDAFLKAMGFTRDEVIGKVPPDLGIWTHPADLERLAALLHKTGECRDLEVEFTRKSGETVWGLISASLIEIESIPCALTITRDITRAKAAEDEIRNLAFYDTLTGLPNRRLLLERLHQAMAAGRRNRRMSALLFVDLDDFKTLNDTLGHQTGDLLLQEAAHRLAGCVREADTVGRLGGDEFVLLLADLSDTSATAAAQAKVVGEKILASISQPYLLQGRECRSSASIGISVFGDRQATASDLLQQADIAMYQAKAAGRNTLRFFAPELQAAVNARAAMEDDLRQGIETGQFVLYYQPQIDRNRLTGAEALVRWRHPWRNILPPGEFIALAEETGLILPLGKWVLEAACAQIAAWSERRQSARLSISVNISARQFHQPYFVDQVLTVLETSGADPRKLKLELTESMLVENIEDVIAKMTALRAHGIRFSLDDFGTGYSSLAYLKRMPLDQLKIDRSFIRDILNEESSAAIAQTIISLSRAMALPVIAEGVETAEQREFLTRLGCHAFQGYLFGRPEPIDRFELQWLPAARDSISAAS